MGFRLVPKSVTLNDLERHNGRLVCVISLNSVGLGPYYAKVVQDTRIHSASKMYLKESSFYRYISYGDIRMGSSPARALKCSALLFSSQNFAYNQP